MKASGGASSASASAAPAGTQTHGPATSARRAVSAR